MFRAVTAQSDIARCQQSLMRSLRKYLPETEVTTIGFPGGSLRRRIHYRDNLWFSTQRASDSPIPRYWNAFGLSRRESGNQTIAVEINPPIKGYAASTSGLFARDVETSEYVLLHRGRIGGGRKGIGKGAFADWFRGVWVDVSGNGDRVDKAILVAHLTSPHVANQISAFVAEVARFKDEVTSGRLTRRPRGALPLRAFSPEFHGTKTGHRSSVLEYESFHGLVVNELEKQVRLSLGTAKANVFNSLAIDLGVEVGNKLTQLFEVKSSFDTQHIYTAVGQLFIHSGGDRSVAKTIVIPERGLNPRIRSVLSTLGVSILEYRVQNGRHVRFRQ